MSAAYDRYAGRIADYQAAFRPLERQIGAVYAIKDKLMGIELFGTPRCFARAFTKLLRGAALQTIAGVDHTGQDAANPSGFLRGALTARGNIYPSVGLGEQIRFDGGSLGGGALRLDGELVHLFVFPR
jgi:hypothetical protein